MNLTIISTNLPHYSETPRNLKLCIALCNIKEWILLQKARFYQTYFLCVLRSLRVCNPQQINHTLIEQQVFISLKSLAMFNQCF